MQRWTEFEISKWPYYVAIGERVGLIDIDPNYCALLVIDMQKNCMADGVDMAAVIKKYNPEIINAYEKRLNNIVWPNLEKLVAFFRDKKIPIIFTILNQDEICRLAPKENEIVLNKPRAGAFTFTELDKILKDRKIETIFITGVSTAHCVTFTSFQALDIGYQVVLIKDASADLRPDHFNAAIKLIELHGYIQTTKRVIQDFPWKKWIDNKPRP